jgi:hypothetical protein
LLFFASSRAAFASAKIPSYNPYMREYNSSDTLTPVIVAREGGRLFFVMAGNGAAAPEDRFVIDSRFYPSERAASGESIDSNRLFTGRLARDVEAATVGKIRIQNIEVKGGEYNAASENYDVFNGVIFQAIQAIKVTSAKDVTLHNSDGSTEASAPLAIWDMLDQSAITFDEFGYYPRCNLGPCRNVSGPFTSWAIPQESGLISQARVNIYGKVFRVLTGDASFSAIEGTGTYLKIGSVSEIVKSVDVREKAK